MVRGAGDADADFLLEIVTRARLALYPGWGGKGKGAQTSWLSGGAVPTDQRIAAGDSLNLRIWDAEDSSLLSPAGAPFGEVTNVVVTASGHVSLPYIDPVHVGGLTLETARTRLQQELTSISPSAQVQLAITQGRRNSVEMVGGVRNPGTYPLHERNLPLTSAIASAGGVDPALNNPQVQITRGGTVYRRALDFVLENPAHDPPLQGGDRVVVTADVRRFKALGAAGREDVIAFDAETVSALRAVSLMGGMADTRADPKGLLVLRTYPARQSLQPYGSAHDRVVFSFDLTTADGVFNADAFHLHDGDIVMATQAVATTTTRVLALFQTSLGAGRGIGSL
ncbi:MAG: polysaccharide export protein [Rhodobacteraceae bacterium]|nr:MAG: polysaccharide export protein [Paracoccaceae bacterium]